MTSKFTQFKKSPLSRHPALLIRKVLVRLGLGPRFVFEDAPANLRWSPRPEFRDKITKWVSQCEVESTPYPWTRVFRQDFDEADLLEWCEKGPLNEKSLLGDTKLIWEFSRLQGIFLNTAQADTTSAADRINKWMGVNKDPNGLNWTNAMEVAIRASNLIAANALSGEVIREQTGDKAWLDLMWNHANAIEARLEAKIVSSNHYLADLMGLAIIAVHAEGHPKVDKWRKFAVKEFQIAILNQSHTDGGTYEASLPYHALITEMALLFTSLPGIDLLPEFRNRLNKMCTVLADMMDLNGDVFCFGDDDGGRILPLDFISSYGRSEILLLLAKLLGLNAAAAKSRAVYPESGWARISKGFWTLAVEFGGAGFYGQGAHAHNDTLSFCLNYKNHSIIVDPGSYLYSGDPAARNRYRSTRAHNTLGFIDEEHASIPADNDSGLFSLPGPEQPARITKQSENIIGIRFDLPGQRAVLSRTLTLSEEGLTISDTIESSGPKTVSWGFHCGPDISIESTRDGIRMNISSSTSMIIRPPENMDVTISHDFLSPFYGSQVSAQSFRGTMPVSLPTQCEWSISLL